MQKSMGGMDERIPTGVVVPLMNVTADGKGQVMTRQAVFSILILATWIYGFIAVALGVHVSRWDMYCWFSGGMGLAVVYVVRSIREG
jgi:hypothetical protein